MGDELQFGLTEDEYRRVLMSNARERLDAALTELRPPIATDRIDHCIHAAMELLNKAQIALREVVTPRSR